MANQLARRNLRDEQRSYLRGKYWQAVKLRGRPPEKGENVSPFLTREQVAEHDGVTHRTVANDAQYAAAVDVVERNVPGARDTILAGESGLPKAEVARAGREAAGGAASGARAQSSRVRYISMIVWRHLGQKPGFAWTSSHRGQAMLSGCRIR